MIKSLEKMANDSIFGGPGDDILKGGPGIDIIIEDEIIPESLTSTDEDVEWIFDVNVLVSNNNITKIFDDKGWNAGAISSKVIILDNDAYVESTINETNTWRMFGFSGKDDSQHRDDIEFGMYMYEKKQWNYVLGMMKIQKLLESMPLEM